MDDSILLLNRVLADGYELRLLLSCGWLEFQCLDTSCDWLCLNTSYNWLHPMTESSSGGWMQLEADSILRLTMSCGWLEFQCLDTNYSWLHATASSSFSGSIRVTDDSILRLNTRCSWFYPVADSSFAGWTRLVADLYFNISSKFKDLFSKLLYFYGLFSTTRFSVTTDSRSGCCFKNLEEAWRSLKKLQDFRCGWI